MRRCGPLLFEQLQKIGAPFWKEETSMSELRYPNESKGYRDARAALLKDEQELADKVKSVAEKRRKLPLGGQLKEDYVFQWANDGKVGKSVKFSELFADKDTLLLYSFMFGPNWDKPCPSCTSLVDGFDRTWYQVTQDASLVAIAKAPAERMPARVSMRSSERLVALTKLHPRRMGTWRPALPPRGIYAGESDATSMSEF